MKLLFVCELNSQRSPTVQKWFEINKPQYEIRSAGTHGGYPYSISTSPISDTLEWADRIYVMDLLQHQWIFLRYPEYRDKLHIIGISDQFNRYEDRLCGLIMHWAENIEKL